MFFVYRLSLLHRVHIYPKLNQLEKVHINNNSTPGRLTRVGRPFVMVHGLSSPPKGPAPAEPGATGQSSAGDFLAGLVSEPPATCAQPDPQSTAGQFLAASIPAPAAFLAAPAPAPAADLGRSSRREIVTAVTSTGSAADFLASTNPNPDLTLVQGTPAADFLASTDSESQAPDHDAAALAQARAVLFWSGGLRRTAFRAWKLTARLGRQAREAGRQVFELYVCVEALRFEAPQLEWLQEERITRLFLELHPLVTAQPLQSEVRTS